MPSMILNAVGVVLVAFTLAVNLLRLLPLVSLAAAGVISLGLYAGWVRAGRPHGVARAVTVRARDRAERRSASTT